MERRYLRIWSIITVFVILVFFAMRLPIDCMALETEPEVSTTGESISEPEPEQSSESEPDQGSELEPEQSGEPELELDYSSVGNLNMSEIVSLYTAVLQIRNCLIFLIFGVIPLLLACLLIYLYGRWIYRLILSAV